MVWAFFGTLTPLRPVILLSHASFRRQHIAERRSASSNNRVVPSIRLTRLFSCDEIYAQIVRNAKAQSIPTVAGRSTRGAGKRRLARKRRGFMADKIGKFDVSTL